jgi:hypothetical protein
MSNKRILATEEMVGYGHATKEDTLNRLVMVEHNEDGTHQSSGSTTVIAAFQNLSFVATVSSKALTIALKGEDGNAPSGSNIVSIKFRATPVTDGKPVVRNVISPLSIVLSSGSTLGFTVALAGRIYIWAIDNAGTVELALSRAADVFCEENLVSTTAEGGAGGADSATVMYSTTARASLACRCLGYINITTGAVPGEWDNSPTKLQLMSPGVARTGQLVQVRNAIVTSVVSGSTVIPNDDTIPQNTEGFEVITCAITPKDAVNSVFVQAAIRSCQNDGDPGTIISALFQDATANALASAVTGRITAGMNVFLNYLVPAIGTVAATTLKIRIGPTGSVNLYVNSIQGSTTRFGGGTSATTLTLIEIAA